MHTELASRCSLQPWDLNPGVACSPVTQNSGQFAGLELALRCSFQAGDMHSGAAYSPGT